MNVLGRKDGGAGTAGTEDGKAEPQYEMPHRKARKSQQLAIREQKRAAKAPVASQASQLTLTTMPGIASVRAWGLRLSRDIAAWGRGEIGWSEVDRGMLLFGPPGVGKSTFAEALAAECKCALVKTSYTDWQTAGDTCLGDVLKRMRQRFAEAKERAPSILFIEEIDSLSSREQLEGRNREWYVNVINAVLEAFDGLKKCEGVVVIGATNHPDRIDPALRRAGRLDRAIEIALPSVEELAELYRYFLGRDLAEASLGAIALACSGMSGADVEQIVRDARRIARDHSRAMQEADLHTALRQGEPERPAALLRRVALHELGHAVVALMTGHAQDGSISVVARGNTLGRTSITPVVRCRTKTAMIAEIAVHLAGHVTETVFLGEPATGSGGGEQSDLAKATHLATEIELSYGMSEHGLAVFRGEDRAAALLTLPERRNTIELTLQRGQALASQLIEANRGGIERALTVLLERKGLSFVDLRELLRLDHLPPRPDNDLR